MAFLKASSVPTALEHELIRIARAFRRLDPETISFADGPPINVTERLQHYPSNAATPGETALVTVIRRTIYFQCYVRRFEGPVDDATPEVLAGNGDDLIRRLCESNQSRHRWDPHWQVYRCGIDGEVQVQKGDVRRFPVPGEFAFDVGPGVRPVEGDFVRLKVFAESLALQPGYYYCFGEEVHDEFDDFAKVRFYFNIEPDDGPPLVEYLSRQLNRFQVPFQLKCPSSPDNYDRTDAAVLYLSSRWYQIAVQFVEDLARTTLPHLPPHVPLFTRQLWPGIGFAEDPEDHRSFGEHRCRLVAEAIIAAWQQSDTPPDDVLLQMLRHRFAEAGISLDRPWLKSGTTCDYELPVAVEVMQ